jgi:GH15 family glucan-1,4-alpha-glucosidase
LWLAQWRIATARSPEDLNLPLALLHWTVQRATTAGMLAEQYDPYSGAPLSVSPLTWSHATYCLTVDEFLRKQAELLAARPMP